MMKKSKRISLRLNLTQMGLIRKLAEKYDSTQSQIIRTWIHTGLIAEHQKGTIPHYKSFPQGGK